MSIPALTDAQRAAALVKATAVRSARRAFKERVTEGEFTIAQAIAHAKKDDALAGIRVRDLVQCVPGVGPKRAATLMESAGISAARRIRGLGTHQVDALVARERR